MELKRCSGCSEEKPATREFFTWRGPRKGRAGRFEICHECNRARANKHRHENPETYTKIERRRYARDREKRIAASVESARRNPHRRQYMVEWFRKNKEKRYLYVRKWNAENPERVKRYLATCHRNRQAQKCATGTHTTRDIHKQLAAQKECCWWCNKPLLGCWEVDHRIPLSRGGSNGPENIVISCRPCNRRKGAKMPWQIENPRLL